MMKIELWVDDENYKDIFGFLGSQGIYHIWDDRYFYLAEGSFLTFLRELHSYLNNKDNWAESFSGWEPIELIIGFNNNSVMIEVYDRYQ